MNIDTLHTPLEVLLFFQSLRTHSIDSTSFGRISSILQGNEFIHQNSNYNAERLSPSSLQALYLQLLKDELRSERNSRASPVKDGEYNPKKRKLSTPPLQTIEEAAEHKHLIPRLVNRLYARYRDHAVQVILEEEQRYRILTREIEEIEQGQWDGRLQAEEEARKTQRVVPSIQTLLRDPEEDEVIARKPWQKPAEPEPAQEEKKPSTSTTNGAAITPGSSEIGQLGVAAPIPRAPVPPSTRYSQTVPLPARREDSQGQARPTPPSQAQPPLPPLPYLGASSFEQQRPSTRPPSVSGQSAASPRLVENDRGPASPIILPPPPLGTARASKSPTAPTPNLPLPPPGQAPLLPPPSPIPQQSSYSAQRPYPYFDHKTSYNPSYPHYGQQHPVPPHPPSARVQIPPYVTPVHAGYGTPAIPSGSPLYPSPSHFGIFQSAPPTQHAQRTGLPSHLPLDHIPNNTAPTTSASSIHDKRRLQDLPPIDTSVSSTKWKPSTEYVPREAQKSPVPPDHSPYLPSSPSPSPEFEPLRLDTKVPQTASEETPTRVPNRGRGRGRWGGRGSRGRGGGSGTLSSPAIATPADSKARSQSVASTMSNPITETTSSRRVKAEPTATPTPATADEASLVSTPAVDTLHPSRRSIANLRNDTIPQPGRKRKRADTLEDGTSDLRSYTPVANTTQPSMRPNQVLASRNFPRVVSALLHDIQTHKLASLFAKPITERDAPGYRGLVYQPQDIKSIRGAISAGSRFVASLSDAVAAVATPAGGGAADVDTESTAATPVPASATGGGGGGGGGNNAGSKGGSIWLPRTSDVVPPKAIVNSAQLEKEVCRMFANAVMFNPDPKRGVGPSFRFSTHKRLGGGVGGAARAGGRGRGRGRGGGRGRGEEDEDEDEERSDAEEEQADSGEEFGDDGAGGFVRDAREMFEDVERSVQAWRAAERVNDDGSSGGGSVAGKGGEVVTEEGVGKEEDGGWEEGLRRSRRG